MDNRNLSETLPYGKLAMLGIDKEKADLLPQEVKEKLLSGEVTPLMQVSIRAQNGNAVTLPLKLQLVTDLSRQGGPRNGTQQGSRPDTAGSGTPQKRRGHPEGRGCGR